MIVKRRIQTKRKINEKVEFRIVIMVCAFVPGNRAPLDLRDGRREGTREKKASLAIFSHMLHILCSHNVSPKYFIFV